MSGSFSLSRISDIASRPKICAKFPGLYKLVRSPIGICFFIREKHIHTHTCAHTQQQYCSGNHLYSYYNLNQTERDETYNTNISRIISSNENNTKYLSNLYTWFLTNKFHCDVKKKIDDKILFL